MNNSCIWVHSVRALLINKREALQKQKKKTSRLTCLRKAPAPTLPSLFIFSQSLSQLEISAWQNLSENAGSVRERHVAQTHTRTHKHRVADGSCILFQFTTLTLIPLTLWGLRVRTIKGLFKLSPPHMTIHHTTTNDIDQPTPPFPLFLFLSLL